MLVSMPGPVTSDSRSGWLGLSPNQTCFWKGIRLVRWIIDRGTPFGVHSARDIIENFGPWGFHLPELHPLKALKVNPSGLIVNPEAPGLVPAAQQWLFAGLELGTALMRDVAHTAILVPPTANWISESRFCFRASISFWSSCHTAFERP